MLVLSVGFVLSVFVTVSVLVTVFVSVLVEYLVVGSGFFVLFVLFVGSGSRDTLRVTVMTVGVMPFLGKIVKGGRAAVTVEMKVLVTTI